MLLITYRLIIALPLLIFLNLGVTFIIKAKKEDDKVGDVYRSSLIEPRIKIH